MGIMQTQQRLHAVAVALVRSLPATGRTDEDVQRAASEWRWRHLAAAAIVACDSTRSSNPEPSRAGST
jgi:hypothetical protein